MNNLKKTIESPLNNIKEYEYIKEFHTFEGRLKFCNLCNIFETNIREHLQSDGHKNLKELNKGEPLEDKYVAYKMQSLSQTDDELNAVSNLVVACEQAIKLVSDELHEVTYIKNNDENVNNLESADPENDVKIIAENVAENEASLNGEKCDAEIVCGKNPRLIKGVMRAGLLANGLLMRGETEVTLVIISSIKPTESIFSDVANRLLTAFKTVSQNTAYNIELNLDEAYMKINPIYTKDSDVIPVVAKIFLTSTLMRKHPFHKFNDDESLNPEGMLDEKLCSSTLQMLRRARWFDSKVYNLPHCEAVLKILRNLINTNEVWFSLSYWSLQIIVYRALSSIMETSIRSSQALLRVFEMLASGYLLNNGPGLMDPCERELTNLCDLMTLQERENITYFCQKAVRLISSKQINKLLDIPNDFKFNL